MPLGEPARWREVTTMANNAEYESGVSRASDECYWCGGDLAEGGSIKIRMNPGEPKRETCPDCFRDWPPEEVETA